LCTFSLLLSLFNYALLGIAYSDSLETKLKSYKEIDTIRIDLLTDLAYYYQSIDPEKTIQYATEANQYSKQLGDHARHMDGIRVIGIAHAMKGDFSKAMEIFKSGLQLAREKEEKVRESRFLEAIGITNSNLGYNNLALEYFNKAIIISEEINDIHGMLSGYNSIGGSYANLGNFPKALEYFQKSLPLTEKHGRKRDLSSVINNIAGIEGRLHNYDTALYYFQMAVSIDQEAGDIGGMAFGLSNMGIIYRLQDDYPKAIEHFQESYELSLQVGDKYGVAVARKNLGKTLAKDEKYKKALEHYNEALKLAYQMGNRQLICELQIITGETMFLTNRLNEALDYSTKGLETALSLDLLEEVKEVNWLLSDIYAKRKEFEKAYEHHKTYKELSDSIFNEANVKKIERLKSKYEFDKEKKVLEEEQKRKELVLQQEKQQQVVLRNYFVIGFIVFLALSIVIFRSLQRKRRSNKKLAQLNSEIRSQNQEIQSQNEHIEKQNEELQQINQQLVELDEFKQGLTGMIVHDLKNPLNAILNPSESLPVENQLKLIKQYGKQMLNMVLNILDTQKYKDTKMVVDFSKQNLSEILSLAMEQVQFLCEQKSIELKNNITGDYKVMVDLEVITRVFVNLLTNALKFTPVNGIIRINTEELNESGTLRISIEDNGVGIPAEKLKVVFEKFVQVETKDSGSMKSTGLGLSFCKLAVDAHGWDIGVDSEPGVGSKFWFTMQPIGKMVTTSGNEMEQVADKNLPQLTDEDITQISEILNELKSTKIYNVSKLYQVLNGVKQYENENIIKWKDAVMQAIRTEDEKKYELLLN
ncbi:MAG: tetratricopeptide repeat-containing sensor histidine kinase, partial [Bacteroidales bacterium]|nr:tetratricopeptide repeat-containing sensor histidine kinase [Bacteroidales bacterium]